MGAVSYTHLDVYKRQVMGVSGGVWECGKPVGFSIISMPQSEGGKGEVTFSLRPRRGRSLAPPFPPSRPQAIPAAADFLFATFSFGGDCFVC